jgi:hypothetical protein
MSEGRRPPPLRSIPGRKGAGTTVFVCGSCDGNGRKLAKTLRREGRQRLGKRSVRVVRTGCLGLCPKRSVSLVVIRQGRSETLLTTPGADPGAVADALFALPSASP